MLTHATSEKLGICLSSTCSQLQWITSLACVWAQHAHSCNEWQAWHVFELNMLTVATNDKLGMCLSSTCSQLQPLRSLAHKWAQHAHSGCNHSEAWPVRVQHAHSCNHWEAWLICQLGSQLPWSFATNEMSKTASVYTETSQAWARQLGISKRIPETRENLYSLCEWW